MTIRAFTPGALAANRSADMFVAMRRELDGMQRQLATGMKSDSFGGLGFERRSSLDARGKMAMLAGYQSTIQAGTLRLTMMSQVAERLDGMARETRSDLLGSGFDIGADGRGTAQNLAEQRLREALDHLNKDVNGRFLFAGRSTDAAPVESYDLIMKGDATRAGLETLIDERTRAELGAGGLGRLTLAVSPPLSPTTVRLTGNNPALPFGFKIVSATVTPPTSPMAATFAGGPPEDATFTLSGRPAQGDKIKLGLLGPDGVAHTVELTARNEVADNERDAFKIGADISTTIMDPKGLKAVLETAIKDKATAVLAPRAAVLAAQEFFDGSAANAPTRVAPPAIVPSSPSAGVLRFTGDVSPYGFAITGATTTTGATVDPLVAATSGPPATPESLDLQFTVPPTDGQTITLQLTDRSGASHTVVLTAKTAPAATDRSAFQIDASLANTIDNITAAAERALSDKAAAVLGSEEATRLDETDSARPTVIWYKGDTSSSARTTAALQIDSSQMVATGAQANEDAIKAFLAQLGVLSAVRFGDTPADRDRYTNLTGRVRDNLSPAYGQPRLEELATDFGAALSTMAGAKDRHRAAANMLQDTLDTVEQASTEETAATMLNLQTRLQASYQTTAMLSRLSLVNFL